MFLLRASSSAEGATAGVEEGGGWICSFCGGVGPTMIVVNPNKQILEETFESGSRVFKHIQEWYNYEQIWAIIDSG